MIPFFLGERPYLCVPKEILFFNLADDFCVHNDYKALLVKVVNGVSKSAKSGQK